MAYPSCFEKALKDAESNNLYLGTGNPNSKILIIGKELGFDNSEQAEREITNNIVLWQENIIKKCSLESIHKYSTQVDYNPLFPYKGQARLKDNKINNGTSNTWLNYQKIHDDIYPVNADEIIFHKDFFLTEINQIPSKASKDQDKNNRIVSIESRKEFIRNSVFFQSFPITILTCNAYMHESEVQKLFEKKNLEKGEEILHIPRNPCIKYLSKDKNEMVILTRQLSNSLNPKLLPKISSEISNFSKENRINL